MKLRVLPLTQKRARPISIAITCLAVLLFFHGTAPVWSEELASQDASASSPSPPIVTPDGAAANPVEPPALTEEVTPPLPVQDLTPSPARPEPQVEIDGASQSPSRPKVALYFNARGTHDDNIFISPAGDEESDYYLTLSPGIAAGWGDIRNEIRSLAISSFLPLIDEYDDEDKARGYIYGSYSPTATIFARHTAENVLDHDARLKAQMSLSYLTLDFSTTFQTLSGPDQDLGQRVSRSIFTTELSAQYDYSDRTSIESSLSFMLRNYEFGLNSKEVENENWLNYEYGPKTTVGVGARFGYLEVEASPSQFYEQLLGRVEYKVTNKIRAIADAGVELRQFQDGGQQADPVFGLELDYRPFPRTEIMVLGARKTQNSAGSADQNIVITSAQFKVRQRFLKRFYLGAGASYANYTYKTTAGTEGVGGRVDDTFTVRPSIMMELTKKAGLELAFEHRENHSTFSDFSFIDNQVFLQLNVLF